MKRPVAHGGTYQAPEPERQAALATVAHYARDQADREELELMLGLVEPGPITDAD